VSKECSPKVAPLKLSHQSRGFFVSFGPPLLGINMLHCRRKKGIAIPQIRAHSEMTVIEPSEDLVAVLAE
jgi:hypothetical protein